MKKWIIAVLVISVIAIVGCGKEESDEGGGGSGATISNPFPMGVGNWWAYMEYETTTKPDTTHDTTKIIGTADVNGKHTYVMINTENPNDTSYLYEENGYIHELYYSREMGRWIDFKLLKTPLSVGDRWTVHSESDSNTSFTQTAEAVGSENVTVPAGTFSGALLVKYTTVTSFSYGGHTYADTSYNYVHFADNIGAVKMRGTEEPSGWQVSELEGYNVH